jgi:hypothetical protein
MKKVLLGIFTLSVSFIGTAQVIFNVQAPESLEGSYDMTYATNWGQTPDLSNFDNSITGVLHFVNDGTSADSLGCETLVNAEDLNGKIAVVYRGTCQYGTKALKAQEAGAIAVIIINNAPGGPVDMGPGTDGPNVTIPVVMIGMEDGALLRDEIEEGSVSVYIFNKTGLFVNDLGIYKEHIFYPSATSLPFETISDATDFSYTPAVWINNYGSQNQTDAFVNVVISRGLEELYNESSSGISINSNDSILVVLPLFSQESYEAGVYKIVMRTGTNGVDDDFENDNVFSFSFNINLNQVFAFARYSEDGVMLSNGGSRGTGSNEFTGCIIYQSPKASLLAFDKVEFGIVKSAGAVLDGEYVTTLLFEWTQQFDDLDNLGVVDQTSFLLLGQGDYSFDNGELGGELVFSTIRDNNGGFIPLENNKRYLVCVNTSNDEVFVSWDNGTDRRRNIEEGDKQPHMAIMTTNGWSLGFSNNPYSTPSIAAHFVRSAELGLFHQKDVVNITPYPNPAVSVLNIPLVNLDGNATLQIVDVMGRSVKNEKVSINGSILSVDVTTIPNGTYLFNMNFENGKSSTFRVVINK